MNPPKNDAWPAPSTWRHVWARFDRSNLAPLPGLILDWRRQGTKWSAWVIWTEVPGTGKWDVRQGWVPSRYLRPARSDMNVWNDGPWR